MGFTEHEILMKIQINEILTRITNIYSSIGKSNAEEMAETWLDLDNYNFGGVSPIELIECGKGDEVLHFIRKAEGDLL